MQIKLKSDIPCLTDQQQLKSVNSDEETLRQQAFIYCCRNSKWHNSYEENVVVSSKTTQA